MIKTAEVDADHETYGDDLDIRALWAAVRRKKFWIILPTLAALSAAGAFVSIVKPRYTAEAQVLLENQESFFTRPERSEAAHETASAPDPENVASQVQLVTSRDLGRRAVDALHLIGNPEFDPLAQGLGPLSRVMILFGIMRDPTRIPAEDRVLEAYLERLTVFSPPKTRVVTIQFRSTDPDLAARAANLVAALYLDMQSDAKRSAAKAAAVSLAAEISDLRIKVAHAEADAEQFRASNGLLTGSNNMSISSQQFVELNSDLSKARTAQADAQAKASLIREMIRQGRIGDVPDVANNDLVRRIAEQRVTAKSQLSLESRTLLPEHPRIKELTAQIAGLDAELRAAAEKTARSLENEARIAASRVANMETAIAQQKQNVTLANSEDVHLRELERVAQGYRDQLQSSTTKYQEAVAHENSPSTPADARIFANASVPQEPTYPKKWPTLIFAGMAGFILSLGTIVSGELLSSRPGPAMPKNAGRRQTETTDFQPQPPEPEIAERQTARSHTRIPMAVEPPSETAKRVEPELIEPGSGDLQNRDPAKAFGRRGASRIAEQANEVEEQAVPSPAGGEPGKAKSKFRTSSLKQQIEGKGVRIIATSLVDDRISTSRIIGFARKLARDGRPVIVDLDLHSTRLSTLVGPRPKLSLGLTDLLNGLASFAEVIHRDHASRLHFVSFGVGPVCEPDKLDMVFDALSQTYEFLVIAAPALAASDLAKELASHADLVVLAAPAAAVEREVQDAADALYGAGAAEVLVLDATFDDEPALAWGDA